MEINLMIIKTFLVLRNCWDFLVLNIKYKKLKLLLNHCFFEFLLEVLLTGFNFSISWSLSSFKAASTTGSSTVAIGSITLAIACNLALVIATTLALSILTLTLISSTSESSTSNSYLC